jgi:hypothetical protein
MVAVGLLAQSASGAAGLGPKALFGKLQTVPLRNSELPVGFRLPPADQGTHPGRPTAWSPSHPVQWRPGGAELAFALRGPDRLDLLGYTVYQTKRQALAALAVGPKGHRFGFAPPNSRLVGKVPGYRDSTLWRADVTGAVVLEADVVSGYVAVRSLTVVTGDAGDVQGNVALARAALKHLATVDASVKR